MDEEGFKFAFDVVGNGESESDCLHSGRDVFPVPDFGTEVVEEGVDEDGTGVFGEEDGFPSNLGA